MKVKMLVSDYGIRKGDIVNAKYFKDISDQEWDISNNRKHYSSLDIFIDTNNKGVYGGFMFDDEVEILESEE